MPPWPIAAMVAMPARVGQGFGRRHFVAGAAALALVSPFGVLRALGATDQRIEIVGNRFFFGQRPLRLTGVAVGDPTYIRAKRPLSDYRSLAQDWRANCARISVLPGLWRQNPSDMEAALAANVAAARAAGLFVIIDWHRVGFPGKYDPLVPSDWGLPADVSIASVAESATFWGTLAQRYASDPAVLFELWNEPSADARLWKATGQDWPMFKAAWEEIIAAIRPYADNIILCAGGYWAHDLVGVKDNLIADARTAFVWHSYPNAERGDMPARIRALGGLQEVKPIVVTEWGFSPEAKGELHGTVADFAEPFVTQVLDAFGLSHTAWCYSSGAMPNLLADDAGTRSGAGDFVRDLLRQAAKADAWTQAPKP